VEVFKSTDDDLITEIKQLRATNKELEYCLQTIRVENKKEHDIKNKIIEKMNITLLDIQADTKDMCSNYEKTTLENVERIKILEEQNQNYLNELDQSQRDMNILNDELSSCKAQIEDIQNNFEEYKLRLEYKDCVIENINEQNLELITKLNRYQGDQEESVDMQFRTDKLVHQIKVNLLF